MPNSEQLTIPEWDELGVSRADYAEPDDAGVEHLVPPEDIPLPEGEEDGS